jgi:hypothetical protein
MAWKEIHAMSEKQRPNVVGKGRAFARDALAVIAEVKAGASKLSAGAQEKINVLSDKGAELEKVLKMPFIGTVKAGEMAYDLNEAAQALKSAVGSGDEAKSLELVAAMGSEVDQFVHTTKTFVVRMT